MTFSNDEKPPGAAPDAPAPATTGTGEITNRIGEADPAPKLNERKAPLRGSFSQDDGDRPRWGPKTVPVSVYNYHDEAGNEIYSVNRGKNSNGEKCFKIDRLNTVPYNDRLDPEDKAERFSGMGDQPHTLYRLPQLYAANAADPVFICEGEKDADSVAELGLVATTNSSGAGKWRDKFSEHLADRHVVILPDNDDVGRDHADKVLWSVHPVARSVKIIELPNLPDKGDVSDWIEAGGTKADLLKLVTETEPIANVESWLASRGQSHVRAKRKNNHSAENVMSAVTRLGVKVRYDAFALRTLIDGLLGFGPVLDDAALIRMRLSIEKEQGIMCPKDRFHDIIIDHARKNAFHPVKDYFKGLRWDGVQRLDTWLPVYGQAEDTEYVRAVSALVLIASVRRIDKPGTKFDQMPVLEGGQGCGKSSGLKTMAIEDEWFLDDMPLDADTKEIMERLPGHLIVEMAEMNGIRRGDIEKVKAFVSRTSDIARLSYARTATEQKRQCIFFGSTNSAEYLRDTTGNRRFWPVKIGGFDLPALARDRDQIWAEAVVREREGASIELPKALWSVAAGHQGERLATDPWEDVLFGPLADIENGKVRTELVWQAVDLADRSRRNQALNTRVGEVMRKHGWTNKQVRFGGVKQYAYVKGDGGTEIDLNSLVQGGVAL